MNPLWIMANAPRLVSAARRGTGLIGTPSPKGGPAPLGAHSRGQASKGCVASGRSSDPLKPEFPWRPARERPSESDNAPVIGSLDERLVDSHREVEADRPH